MSDSKVIYPDLSYKIVGILYEVHNELGGGLKEKTYQKAVCKLLRENNLKYKEELHVPVIFKGEKVGDYYLDLLVEGKVILELKTGDHFKRANINQIIEYLKLTDSKLGILANFGHNSVKFKRILNVV